MNKRDFINWAGSSAMALCLPVRAAAAIRMGYFEKYAPFSQRSDSGVMSGALIEGLELVGNSCGVDFEHFGYPWARAQVMVERGELDGFCTVRTQDRQRYAEFCTTPIVSVDYGIFHRVDDVRPLAVRSVEDLRALRQGTYLGSGYTKANLEPERMQYDKDEESILRRVASGSLDSFIEAEIGMQTKLKDLGLSDRIRFTPAAFLPKAEFCFGLRRSHADVAKIVPRMEAATLAARKTGALQAILAKYR